MKHFITISLISILLLCEQSLFAQSYTSDSLFSRGVSFYQKGEYEAAIKVFMQCDSLDFSDDQLNDNRKVYSKIWIASSYYQLKQIDSAISISPNYYKYAPIDRRKTVISDSLSSIAIKFFEKEDYQKALEVLKTCANIERDSLGVNSLWYRNTITECGYLCYNLGNYKEAIKYGLIAKDISLQVCGINSDEHVESLNNLINYYGEDNDKETVRQYLKELESIKTDVEFDDNNELAKALMELAGYYEALEDYNDAVRLINKANDIAGQNSESRGVRNYFLFEDLIHLQQYKKAIIVGQESIKSFEDRISPSDSTYSALGVLYTRLADCYSNIGNFIKAADLCQQAIHIYNISEDRNNAPRKISSLNLLSSCFNDLGLYEDAIKIEHEAIEIMKSMEELDSLKYAIELSNLAFYHSKLGNNVDAYILCEDAYNIVQKLEVSMDNPDLLLILSNLASHFADLGNYSKAVELNKLVLSIRSQTVGKSSFEYATSLNNLATYLSYTEDYVLEDAISLQKESLDIIESVYGKANQYYIESLTNLAVLNDIGKSPSLSLELLNEALLLTDSLFPEKDHPSKILIYYNIANVYNGLKQYDKALNNLQKAYSIMNLYGLEDNQEYIRIKKGLYYSYLKNNNISEAKKWMRETYQSVYCQVIDNFPRLSSREREMFWSLYSEWFYDDLPHLLQYDSSEETIRTLYNSSLLSKGILLSTNIYIDRLLEEENPSLLIELHRLRQTQKILEMADRKELELNPDSIIYSKETAERNLLNGSQVYNGLRNYFKVNYQNIRDVLNERDLAIEFVTMPTDSNEVYYALCLKQDYEAPHIIRLFDLSYKASNSLTSRNSPESLSLTIWEKLKEELLGVEDVYFSPTGELHKIGIEYTSGIEKYNLYRLSSTRNIIELKANRKSDDKNTISAILYGGIDYESKNSIVSDMTGHFYSQDRFSTLLSQSQHRAFIDSLDLRGLKIRYLPGTLKEVQNIKKIIDKKQYDAIIYSGSEATETTMKSLSLHTPQILHIATHGFYFTEDRAKKEDIGRFVVNHKLKDSSIEDKSLSRSGVLFAGANLTINGQDVPIDADDGILTAQEISQLDLRGIDLVVLSACDTGTGDVKQGEGVFGLQRGFKKAGARSILMSLWKVSDVATELLMTEFYKTLCEGKSKRESLRQAQKKVKNYKDSDGNLLFQDSHYWASFVMLD